MIRALLLAMISVWSATAVEPALADDNRIGVNVSIAPSPEGVIATYHLARPVELFRFEYKDDKKGHDSWSLRTPNLAVYENAIRCATGCSFDSFDVAVPIRNEITGATYPNVLRIGDQGRVVYLSSFTGEQAEFRTTLRLVAPVGQTVLGLPRNEVWIHVDRSAYGQAANIYAYVGPREFVHRIRDTTYVFGPEAPAWIQPEIQRLSTRSLQFFRQRAGVPLARSPLFLITWQPLEGPAIGRRSAQADVTDGPNVAFRFFGSWSDKNREEVDDLRHIVPHETAHFWNGHHFHSANGEDAPWLHEGGAEYWAYLAQRQFNDAEPDHIARALNRCVQQLGLRKLGAQTDESAYACGEILEWFADLGMRRHGQDVFALWREMFRRAESNGMFYSVTTFRSLAEQTSPSVAGAFRLVLDTAGSERWSQLPNLLADLGVAIEILPRDVNRQRGWAIMHVLGRVCGPGSYGIWTYDDHVKFDTGDRCGGLSGDAEADAVNGHNMYSDIDAAYAAIEGACKVNGTVTFTRRGADAHSVTCNAPLPPLPPEFKVVSGG